MSPACRVLPSRRDVTGRMRNTEIQPQKRLDQFLRPPTQLQHSLKSLIPISDRKCWDLSGLWVELASVSTDVRSNGNTCIRWDTCPLTRAGFGVFFRKKGMWWRDRGRKSQSPIFSICAAEASTRVNLLSL